MAAVIVMLVLSGMAMFVQISMSVHLETIHAQRIVAAKISLDHIFANAPTVTRKNDIAST